MAGRIVSWRYNRAESVGRDFLVRIVVLEHVSHCFDGLNVLILSVELVERASVSRVAVGKSEVDCNVKVDLTAAKHVLEEIVVSHFFQPHYFYAVIFDLEGSLSLVEQGLEIGEVGRDQFVGACGVVAPKVDLDFLSPVVVAQTRSVHLELVPPLLPSFLHLDFALVDWLVLVGPKRLPNDEENVVPQLDASLQAEQN